MDIFDRSLVQIALRNTLNVALLGIWANVFGEMDERDVGLLNSDQTARRRLSTQQIHFSGRFGAGADAVILTASHSRSVHAVESTTKA